MPINAYDSLLTPDAGQVPGQVQVQVQVWVKVRSNTDIFSMNFGRTGLRIGDSEAKFDVEVAGEVRFPIAPPKPSKNCEKSIFRSNFFAKFVFFGVEK